MKLIKNARGFILKEKGPEGQIILQNENVREFVEDIINLDQPMLREDLENGNLLKNIDFESRELIQRTLKGYKISISFKDQY